MLEIIRAQENARGTLTHRDARAADCRLGGHARPRRLERRGPGGLGSVERRSVGARRASGATARVRLLRGLLHGLHAAARLVPGGDQPAADDPPQRRPRACVPGDRGGGDGRCGSARVRGGVCAYRRGLGPGRHPYHACCDRRAATGTLPPRVRADRVHVPGAARPGRGQRPRVDGGRGGGTRGGC
jgi:hypothetical protein